MQAILVHGMSRFAVSMRPMAKRLKRAGIRPHSFSYFTSYESLDRCTYRLQRFIEARTKGQPYIVIGHSLGSVLLQLVSSKLEHQPEGYFFLAPPTVACRSAKYFRRNILYRMATGQIGQLLAEDSFMASLPKPDAPVFVYVGTGGFRGKWTPFGDEVNDGILAVSEAHYPKARRTLHVKAKHTFIMNSKEVFDDIFAATTKLRDKNCA